MWELISMDIILDKNLNEAADSCVQRYGTIDRTRITDLLSGICEIVGDIDYAADMLFQAAESLGPYPALELFEAEDLKNLVKRIEAVERLSTHSSVQAPSIILSFINHIEENRIPLITTGYPNNSFADSSMLDQLLSKVYPTKLPVAVQSNRSPGKQSLAEQDGEAEKDNNGNLVYSFTWAMRYDQNLHGCIWDRTTDRYMESFEPRRITEALYLDGQTVNTIGGFDWRGENVIAADGRPVAPCTYDFAPNIPGFHGADADRIQSLREPYFNIKVKVLNRVQIELDKGVTDSLLHIVLRILRKDFTGAHADLCFLHEMDEKYLEKFSGTSRNIFAEVGVRDFWQGGIDDLLYFVGAYDCEIRCKYHESSDRIISDIAKLVNVPVESYFSIINEPWREQMNVYLDTFVTVHSQYITYWNEYNGVIEEFFKTEDAIPQHPPIAVADSEPIPEDAPYQIIQQRDAWAIIYDGYKLQSLNDTKAMRSLIKILITSPDEGVTAKSWIRGSSNPQKLLSEQVESAVMQIDRLMLERRGTEFKIACQELIKHLNKYISNRASATVRYTGEVQWFLIGKLQSFQRASSKKK